MFPTVENRKDRFYFCSTKNLSFPDHLHAHIEIHLPVHGTLHAAVDGAKYDIPPSQALLVFPHRIHGSPAGGEAWSGLMLIFTPDCLPDMEIDWETTRPICPVLPLAGDSAYAAERLWQRRSQPHPDRELNALVALLVSGLLQSARLEPAGHAPASDILYKALAYISQSFTDDITLKKTARTVGVNEYYLSHLLSSRIQMNFRQYVNTLRIDQACRLLTRQTTSTEAIANQCGFASLRSFDRVFLRQMGCTPREYRKKLYLP